MIGAREISEYAQKYNMKLGKDTPLSMEWCFNMADKAYEKGRQDAIDDVMKIYNEMRPHLATHIYDFGERIKALKESK